jgi:hypothetical protein
MGVYSNLFGVFSGLHWPQFSFKDLAKDISVSLGEVSGRLIWGLTKDGRTFSEIYSLLEGINGYTVFDNLPSVTEKVFKGIGFALMGLDVIEAGYDSYRSGHSLGQGTINMALTAGKNILVYNVSTAVTTAAGTWVGAKLGASLGVYAGPVGLVIGAVAGAAVGLVIDEFGDVIIDWVVGWFD